VVVVVVLGGAAVVVGVALGGELAGAATVAEGPSLEASPEQATAKAATTPRATARARTPATAVTVRKYTKVRQPTDRGGSGRHPRER
jgi:hypothetical protein